MKIKTCSFVTFIMFIFQDVLYSFAILFFWRGKIKRQYGGSKEVTVEETHEEAISNTKFERAISIRAAFRKP